MYIGVDYYPEQWSENLLTQDLDRIKEIGFDVIRVAEFAWHIFEPRENIYDFSFFDKVINEASERDIKVIFGTPTATMPAWLADKFPEVLSENEFGQKRVFGGRRQYCFNSFVYQDYSRRIVEKLAIHYGNNDDIIGWQIDNEFGHEGSDMCYCSICRSAFRDFLKAKFNSIDELNETYGTVFWSQEYNGFDEIPIPKPTITTHNPALLQDFYRFRAKSITEYASQQIDILKKYTGSKQFVIHNFSGGLFDKGMDFPEVGKMLDEIGYDNYPVWGGLKEPVKPHSTGFALDMMRGLKNKNFWILEQLIGAQGHQIIGYLPRPGQASVWAAQSVAHGADHIVFFRYRAAAKGAEQFCYGLIDHDNIPGRKVKEVRKFIKTMRKSEKKISKEINSDIALIYSMDNAWSWKVQPQSDAFDFTAELERIYSMFFNYNVNIDVIPAGVCLDSYKVVLCPVFMLLNDNLAFQLEDFAAKGGTVVFSFRSGIKDVDNNIIFNRQNSVHRLSGFKSVEFESLQVEQSANVKSVDSKACFKGTVWRDLIKCSTAKTLLKYSDKQYRKYSAVTVNKFKDGQVYYIGTGLESNGLKPIAERILCDANIKYIDTPEGIEVYNRGKKTFVINHTDSIYKTNSFKVKPHSFKIIKSKEVEI